MATAGQATLSVSPVILWISSVHMTLQWDAWVTLGIILLLIIALIREIARPDFLFLLALGIMMISGILTPEEAFSGFSNPAMLTVAALFVVASGVQKTGALSFVQRFMTPVNGDMGTVLFRMMGSTSLLSSFMNNTPIVAMLIPQVQEWGRRTGHSASKLLIPLSYASIVGGTITLIGTSTNLIVSGMLVERGYPALHLFELAWIGIPATILVVLWFATTGYRFLPDYKKEGDIATTHNADGYQFEVTVSADSRFIDRTVRQSGLRNLKKAFLIHIHRKHHIIGPVAPSEVLQEGDILTFSGDVAVMDDLLARDGLQRVISGIGKQKDVELPLYEAVVAPSSSLVGKTLKEAGFREYYQGVVLAIHRRGEQIKGSIGNNPIKAGDLLVIEARKGFADRWNANKDEFYLVAPRYREPRPDNNKAGVALLIIAAMLLLAASGWVPVIVAAFSAAFAMVFTGCINRSDVRQSLNLPILLVIAAALGMGQAIDKTGLAVAGSELIISATAGMGVIAVLMAVYLFTNLLTELVTNNAAAVLVLPLAVGASAAMGIDSHALAVTVAIAASASFLSPIGYQTNLMVMGPGRYKFTDYFKAGLPVTLIMMTVTISMVYLIWL